MKNLHGYKYIKSRLGACKNSNSSSQTCESDSLTLEFTNNVILQVLTSSNTVDLDSISEPLKEHPSSIGQWFLEPNKIYYKHIDFNKIKYDFKDSFMGNLGKSKQGQTHDSHKTTTTVYNTTTGFNFPNVNVYLDMSIYLYQYNRKVMNLLDVAGNLGGLLETIFILSALFIGSLTLICYYLETKAKYKSECEELEKQRIEFEKMHLKYLQNRGSSRMLNDTGVDFYNNSGKLPPINKENVSNFNSDDIEMKQIKQNSEEGFLDSIDYMKLPISVKSLEQKVDYLLKKDPEFMNQVHIINKRSNSK